MYKLIYKWYFRIYCNLKKKKINEIIDIKEYFKTQPITDNCIMFCGENKDTCPSPEILKKM